MRGAVEKLVLACFLGILTVTLYGCGGSSKTVPETPPPPPPSGEVDLPPRHGLTPTGENPIEVAAGEKKRVGNVDITCRAGGAACVVAVTGDGATWTGVEPTVVAAHDPLNVAGLGDNLGLDGTEPIEIAAGEKKRVGNVEITCPGVTGGPACVILGNTYKATGGVPDPPVVAYPSLNVAGVEGALGLDGTEPITIAAGEKKRVGNVEITCGGEAGGAACVILGNTYKATGGVPDPVAAAYSPLNVAGLGDNLGLDGMEPITIDPGEKKRVGNVEITCPGVTGGPACVILGNTYKATGGVPDPPVVAYLSLNVAGLGDNLGLDGTEPIEIAAGEKKRVGNVEITCPGVTGGPACVILGNTYKATGGVPDPVAAAYSPLNVAGVEGALGLDGTEPIEIAAGEKKRVGNVEITCPGVTGGPACVILGDKYKATGPTPRVTDAYTVFTAAPTGHGLMATGDTPIVIAAGEKRRVGNVEITCGGEAGGPDCVIVVAPNNTTITYKATGGMPTAVPAYADIALPTGHGLTATGETPIEVAAGETDEHGNVDITCPADGLACVIVVAQDGTITYKATGGEPTVVLTDTVIAAGTTALPTGHGLMATGETPIEVAAGETDKHGNVDITCPAGGLACVIVVAADGTITYKTRGGIPTITAAETTLTLPLGHAVVSIMINAGNTVNDGRGVSLTCPSDGKTCDVTVTADGATYKATGGVPVVKTNEMILAASNGPSGNSNGGHVDGVQLAIKSAAGQDPDTTGAISQSSVVGTAGSPASVSLDLSDVKRSGTGADITLKLTGNGFASLTAEEGEEGEEIELGANDDSDPPILKGWDGSSFVHNVDSGPTIHAVAHSDIKPARMLDLSHPRAFFGTAVRSIAADPDPDDDTDVGRTVTVAAGNITFKTRTLVDGNDAGGNITIGTTAGNRKDYLLRLANPNRNSFLSNLENTQLPVRLQVFGTWVPGTMTCTTAAGCTGTVDAAGTTMSSVSGDWSLVLNDIKIPVPDWDYMTLGVWLSVPEASTGEFDVGAFAEGKEGFVRNMVGVAANSLDQLAGAATYTGAATGIYAKDARVGDFSATASLTADFEANTANSPGTVEGSVTNFRENGESLGAWTVNLLSATPADNESIIFVGSTGGTADGNALTGKWGAEFFGVELVTAPPGTTPTDTTATGYRLQESGEVTPPTSVAGTFGASWEDSDDASNYTRIIGAFGASKQD